jgi:hypothetical protein
MNQKNTHDIPESVSIAMDLFEDSNASVGRTKNLLRRGVRTMHSALYLNTMQKYPELFVRDQS